MCLNYTLFIISLFIQLLISAFTALGLVVNTPVVSAETIDFTYENNDLVVAESFESSVNLGKNDLLSLTGETLYWVVAVLDGDTILVSAPDRSLFQVRLLAVDTNEINGPDSTAECYGPEATIFTMNFLKDRAVRLSADPANQDTDPFGRKLRFVDALQEDGSFLRLNDALLFEGYATFPEQYPLTNPGHFESLEKSAQSERKGLWGAC